MSIALNEERHDENFNIAVGLGNSLTPGKMPPAQISSSEGVAGLGQVADDSEAVGGMNLPALATANDIREVVQYLKQRPDGVNICDVVQPIKKRIFYPAKVVAYESWGLVTRTGERVKLTSLGWEFAKSLEPEARAYRALIERTRLYSEALQWVHDQGLDLITTNDIASYWQARFSAVFGDDQGADLGKTVVSFFHLCQAAELGTMTIGKRGQPARLRVWRAALLEYVDRISLTKNRPAADDVKNMRVLVSSSNGNGLIEEVRQVLKRGGIESEATEEVGYGKARTADYVSLTICSRP
jgi:hypothetical protein